MLHLKCPCNKRIKEALDKRDSSSCVRRQAGHPVVRLEIVFYRGVITSESTFQKQDTAYNIKENSNLCAANEIRQFAGSLEHHTTRSLIAYRM